MHSRFSAGDTFSLTTSLSDYPASAGWTLTHRFVPRSGSATPIEVVCTASGDAHVALVAATVTDDWVAGTYTFASYVSKAGEIHTVDTGTIELLPDPRAATTLDTRTDAQVALANVRAMLQGVASKNVQRYEINGRALQHYAIPDLIQLEAKLVADVKREQSSLGMAAGRAGRRQIFVRLGRA
jgi:hypothetical protein